MSGHSKWSSIKHKKGAADAKRGKLFTKLARAITVAVRDGGGNPDGNPPLALAVQKARDASMPKDNIQRAIDRGTGEGTDAAAIESVTYEGYGPGGAAILVDGDRYSDEDLIAAIDAGADDVAVDGDVLKVIAPASALAAIRGALEDSGVEITSSELSMEPTTVVEVGAGDAPALLRLMDGLEEHDDVDSVHANFDVPDEILEQAAA